MSMHKPTRRRHPSPLGRVARAAAYALPAFVILLIGIAQPSSSRAAFTCEDVDGETTCVFDTTGSNPILWDVPDGVSTLWVTVSGAQGGGEAGGRGATVYATLEMTTSEPLQVSVGTSGDHDGTPVGLGNDGGEAPDASFSTSPYPGSRGGGASSIGLAGDGVLDLIIAGGGGGQSGLDSQGGGATPATGGDGGAIGEDADGVWWDTTTGGQGGQAAAPGAGGATVEATVLNGFDIDCAATATNGTPGASGTDGQGGAGGEGFAGGGGGGGGFFGGGGGGGSWYCDWDGSEWGGPGGGGGGSSYVYPYDGIVTDSWIEDGQRAGDGYVSIRYLTPDPWWSPEPTDFQPNGYLDATVSTDIGGNPQDLTALGATDWAIWGYGAGGTSESLAPDVRKSGGSAISDLVEVYGSEVSIPLRGLGQFPDTDAWTFSWSDGDPTTTATGVRGGLQHLTGPEADGTGYGFRFDVPAGTIPQRLLVYTTAHGGLGRLTAELSDDSVLELDESHGNGLWNVPGLYTIDFAAGSEGETLTVDFVLEQPIEGPHEDYANVAIHAVALTPQLVVNGGFEEPYLCCESGFVTYHAGSSALTGWDIDSGSIDHVEDYWLPADGRQSIDLDGNSEGTISQTIPTTPGQQYQVSFAYSANWEGSGASMDVGWGSTPAQSFEVSAPAGDGPHAMNWSHASHLVTATDSLTDLTFEATSGGATGIALDDVSVVPYGTAVVDEPPPAPALLRAAPNAPGTQTAVLGRLDAPAGDYEITLYASGSCEDGSLGGEPETLGTVPVTIGAGEAVYFQQLFNHTTSTARYVAITASQDGAESAPSPCVVSQSANDSWTSATPLSLDASNVQGWIDSAGNARWYKFSVVPGARVTVDLSNLPADYDVFLFKDIAEAYTDLTSVQDLTKLTAEFAPSAFAPSAFAPSAFAPSAFAPSAFAPSAFAPSAFAPSAFAPSAFAPSAFAPSAFAPSAFAPSAFAPSAFAPSAFAPSAFAPSAFAPSAFAPSAFASAQVRSLIGVAAAEGTSPEQIVADTWNNADDFYVRVSGKNGAFEPNAPFRLDVKMTGTTCVGISRNTTAPVLAATAGGFETIILTDANRMSGTLAGNSAAAKSTMAARLATFAARPDVKGVVVNVAGDGRVAAHNAQADDNYACPYAKNLVAGSIRDIVDRYRALNPNLRYVVIVGDDDVIPFFRYPDQSLLGPEQDYLPPVGTTTASEASLRSNHVLGQDAYGQSTSISLRVSDFPIPDLAVGRLVERATEVTNMLDAYLATPNGVVATPSSSFVSGYDFIADAATVIGDELGAGIGVPTQRLITPGHLSPQDPASWTATQLRSAFLGTRRDISFLGGHFSANSALAADFTTSMTTAELIAAPVNLTNAIVFSIGCHSGYNIVDPHGVPSVTQTLDWPQAFAQKGTTLIAGTGYQYGDTDFIEFSERIYAEFARQLRVGTGPVAIGDALVRAKQAYLRSTPDIRGLHEKSLLESAVFGLPMLRVDMPAGRIPADADASVIGGTTDYAGPGAAATLGLSYADLIGNPPLTQKQVILKDIEGGPDVTTTYFTGPDGNTTNPSEPALPLDVQNVTVPNQVLRGVGFRGGDYTDTTVIPLTGAPNTEIRGVHVPFASTVFYPMRPWTVNYFDALGTPGGATRLLLTPVQHKSVALGSLQAIARKYADMDLRLFYSDNITTYAGGSTPALSAPPTITSVAAQVDGTTVTFQANVVGDPAAGIEEVWVTYTGHDSRWDSVDLVQDAVDSTLWTGTLTVPSTAAGTDLQFMVQAVNGVGLVTVADNLGAYYGVTIAGAPAPVLAPTTLSVPTPGSGAFGATVPVSATLANGSPVAGKTVVFTLGGAVRYATTNASGVATAQMLVTAPGSQQLTASFAGDGTHASSTASRTFTVAKAATQIVITGPPLVAAGATGELIATLKSGDVTLTQRTVAIRITRPDGTKTLATAITDSTGTVRFAAPSLPVGVHTVEVLFGSNITTPASVDLTDPAYGPSSATVQVKVWQYAFTSRRDGNFEIYTMNADGTGQTRITNHSAIDTEASFSPDGRQIVFASSRTGLGDIYRMNVDGTGLVRLTTSSAIDATPAWSPDGTKIAFTSRRDGNFEIYVMNADGTNQTRLTNNKAIDNEAEWSPDGSRLSFTSTRTGLGDIYLMNANGSGVTRLTTSSAIEGTSAWSPNGTKIAFTSRRDGNFEIYVMNADGTGQTRRTNNNAIDTEPVWSADGSKIVFASGRTGNGDIYAMNPDGTGVVRLTSASEIDGSPASG